MNHRIQFFRSLKFALLAVASAAGLPALAGPVAAETNATPQVVRSVFIQPTSPKEGRDPFFPTSDRPYRSQIVAGSSVPDVGALVLQGISGTPPHQLAIINNVTFGVGDEAEVSTPHGRIRILCVEITSGSAVIESDGQRHELRYEDKP
jgi:hypothetical protein